MKISHPSNFLPTALTDVIRNEAAAAEQQRTLTWVQWDIIKQQNWLNMYVPKQYGGMGLSLPEILRLEEGLSWADGSTAWVVTLCSGAAWFVGFLDAELARKVFENENVCFAGSGAVSGIARKTINGYEIQGNWKYATGSLFATVFTVNCEVMENGKLMSRVDGGTVAQSFLLKKDEIHVHTTWNAMGMIATGSHSFEVKNIVIPQDRTFIIQPDHATLNDPIFQYPFLQLAETTLAVNLSGMAYRFLDLCAVMFSQYEKSLADVYFQKIHVNRLLLDELRSTFYTKTDEAWEILTTNLMISEVMLGEISSLSQALVRKSCEVVNGLYPYCGLEGANTGNEVNRVWRNFHTAGQHGLFRGR